MRRIALLAAAAALAAVIPARARAQFIFGASGGPAFPLGSFSDAYSVGYQGTVSLAVGLPGIPIGFRAEGSYDHFSANRTLTGATTTTAIRIFSGTGNIVYGLTVPIIVTPYLIGGAGAYNVACTESGCTSATRFGFNGGVGVKFGLAGLSVSAEARAHRISSGGGSAAITYVPVTVGITF
ncbi:MAG: outer membrane beta-barrel protein [Gemmatimonadaceae bacterium]